MSDHDLTKNLVDAQHPWLGLLPFTVETRGYFFGRDAEITEIVDRIAENPLTVLFGQSGLGKTSLLGAGVLPKLADAGYQTALVRLDHSPNAPSLMEQTRDALRRTTPGVTWPDEPDLTLWELLHRIPLLLPDYLPVPVIIFDQFEEIFTLGRQDPHREEMAEQWIEQIADLLQNRPPKSLEDRFAENRRLARDYDFSRPRLRFVLSLREDYLSYLEGWKSKLPLLAQNRMALNMLDGLRAIEAVVGPASLGEHPLVSREVAANIVRTVARVPLDTPLTKIRTVPPLLSLLCEQLNSARIAAGAMEIDAAMVSSQSDDILQRFYDSSFQSFPEPHRSAIREVVEDRMITVGGHRHPVAREDAEAELTARGVPNPSAVLSQLIERRLFTTEDQGGVPRLEVTHDVLVPLLVRSRKERREKQAELEKQAAEARARAEARKQAKLRAQLVASLILLLAAIVAGIYAYSSAKAAVAAEARAVENGRKATEALISAKQSAQTAEDALARQSALLTETSVADHEAATRAIDNGRHNEALAHFERALRRDPSNTAAIERSLGELLYGDSGPSRQRFSLRTNGWNTLQIFTPDGSGLLAGGSTPTLRLIDIATAKTRWEIPTPKQVTSAAFDTTSDLLIIGGEDQHLRALNPNSGEEIWNINLETYIYNLSINPQGDRILVACADGGLRLVAPKDGEILATDNYTGSVTLSGFDITGNYLVGACLSNEESKSFLRVYPTDDKKSWDANFDADIAQFAISPAMDFIAAVAGDTLSVFKLEDGTPHIKLKFSSTLKSVAFSPDGTKILVAGTTVIEAAAPRQISSSPDVAASSDKESPSTAQNSVPQSDSIAANLSIIDPIASAILWQKNLRDTDINAAAFSIDGTRIGVAAKDGSLRILETRTGNPSWQATFGAEVFGLAFSPDGSHLAASGRDLDLRVFDLSRHSCLWRKEYQNRVSDCDFSPDGKHIAVVSYDHSFAILDARSGNPAFQQSYADDLNFVDWSPDGKHIAIGGDDNKLHLLESNGKLRWEKPFEKILKIATFSPDSALILAAEYGETARLFKTETGEMIWETTLPDPVNHITFSQDGKTFVIAGIEGSLIAIDSSTLKELWSESLGKSVRTLHCQPDGPLLAIGCADETLRLYNLRTGKLKLRKKYFDWVNSVHFHPNKPLLAVGTGEHTVQILNLDGSEVWEIRLSNAISKTVFSPDGSTLAITGLENILRLLDATTGAELRRIPHGSTIHTCKFSPDGKFVASTNDYGRVQICETRIAPPSPSPTLVAELMQQLRSRGTLRFDESGRLKPIETDHSSNLSASSTPTPDSPLTWLETPPILRTISPTSSILLRDLISQHLRESSTIEGILHALDRAPWHPLAPIATARTVDESNTKYTLARLTIRRLNAANPDLWGPKNLAADASAASSWMYAMQFHRSATEAAEIALKHDPDQLPSLRTIALLENDPQKKSELLEKCAKHPKAAPTDLGNLAYHHAVLSATDPASRPIAIEWIDQLEKQFPNDLSSHYWSGWCHLNLGNGPQAKASLAAALNALGDSTDYSIHIILSGLASSSWLAGDTEDAVSYVNQLLALQPSWAKTETIDSFEWPDAETQSLKLAIAEALRRKPAEDP